ncbi:histone-lysine N-methyltransferase ASHH1 isoform X2 [Ipomoea triloba]|uniref:histone-lysine N-methyltransferase ASHH1 isoform X2 n=1 Tax=Ipomoea triloba TaxID=35885 RepID=UPI00125DF0DE|nr:histone-lysine N-methyltransferase ASHH1 isoform X2 [Ipomoea triloba]
MKFFSVGESMSVQAGETMQLQEENNCEVKLPDGVPPFIHINQNDFLGRKAKKLKDEDIAICECKYETSDPESACGERCLNLLTSTECTPGYCPSGNYCKNQRFQKSEYAKTKLFRTEGRGWGLRADEIIKAGQFIIEYCGEVISSDEARRRSQTYEIKGLKDAYIISLNANYFIDATRKGSLARFINHSCLPNCETRKWTVLGETRVGIFAKQDISIGTELTYNYNFEWYGGATVRCLCGAPNCSIFLGAKSHGFQNHLWEEGDDRYEVDKIPLYDSGEDETLANQAGMQSHSEPEPMDSGRNVYPAMMSVMVGSEHSLESTISLEAHYSGPVDAEVLNAEVNECKEIYPNDLQAGFHKQNSLIPRIRNYNSGRNYNAGPGLSKKKVQNSPKQRAKSSVRKQVTAENVAKLFPSKDAQEEIMKYEEMRNQANLALNSLYNEIRPAIEEHERDSQDSVPTSVAEKWIGASCLKMKSDFDFYFSVVKNVMCPPQMPMPMALASGEGDDPDQVKQLTNE